jgi:hypothetical protein
MMSAQYPVSSNSVLRQLEQGWREKQPLPRKPGSTALVERPSPGSAVACFGWVGVGSGACAEAVVVALRQWWSALPNRCWIQ